MDFLVRIAGLWLGREASTLALWKLQSICRVLSLAWIWRMVVFSTALEETPLERQIPALGFMKKYAILAFFWLPLPRTAPAGTAVGSGARSAAREERFLPRPCSEPVPGAPAVRGGWAGGGIAEARWSRGCSIRARRAASCGRGPVVPPALQVRGGGGRGGPVYARPRAGASARPRPGSAEELAGRSPVYRTRPVSLCAGEGRLPLPALPRRLGDEPGAGRRGAARSAALLLCQRRRCRQSGGLSAALACSASNLVAFLPPQILDDLLERSRLAPY